MQSSVPFTFVESLATDFGAVHCCWKESDHSFTGFVAEVWFDSLRNFPSLNAIALSPTLDIY